MWDQRDSISVCFDDLMLVVGSAVVYVSFGFMLCGGCTIAYRTHHVVQANRVASDRKKAAEHPNFFLNIHFFSQ